MEQEVLIGLDEVKDTEEIPYRGKSKESGTIPFTEVHDVTPVEKSIAIDTKKLSQDLVKAVFKVAHLIKPKIREATEEEVKNIGEPFADIIDKYDLVKYAKYLNYLPEIQFGYNLLTAVTNRIKEVKNLQPELDFKESE